MAEIVPAVQLAYNFVKLWGYAARCGLRYYEKRLKNMPFYDTIAHFMCKNHLINTIAFIWMVPHYVTVHYRWKTIQKGRGWDSVRK